MEYPSQSHTITNLVVYRVHSSDNDMVQGFNSLSEARKLYRELLRDGEKAMITVCRINRIEAITYEYVQGKL